MRFTAYQLKKLIRSYTFIPPYIIYMIWIAMLYVASGNPFNQATHHPASVLLAMSPRLNESSISVRKFKGRAA